MSSSIKHQITRTVSENSRCSDLNTRKNANVIKYSTPVSMALGKVYESSDINTFRTIANPRADGNCYIICSEIKYKVLYRLIYICISRILAVN